MPNRVLFFKKIYDTVHNSDNNEFLSTVMS